MHPNTHGLVVPYGGHLRAEHDESEYREQQRLYDEEQEQHDGGGGGEHGAGGPLHTDARDEVVDG